MPSPTAPSPEPISRSASMFPHLPIFHQNTLVKNALTLHPLKQGAPESKPQPTQCAPGCAPAGCASAPLTSPSHNQAKTKNL